MGQGAKGPHCLDSALSVVRPMILESPAFQLRRPGYRDC
jgi:hypothetical protein